MLWPSSFSGKPGFPYSDGMIVINVTADELRRMENNNLRPDEYFKLRELYPDCFYVLPCFYDTVDGSAIQPLNRLDAGRVMT